MVDARIVSPPQGPELAGEAFVPIFIPAIAVLGAVDEFFTFKVNVSPGFRRNVGEGVPSVYVKQYLI